MYKDFWKQKNLNKNDLVIFTSKGSEDLQFLTDVFGFT